jgi:exosortase/archaeosortase family protein
VSRRLPALFAALVFLGAWAGGEALARAAGERATAPAAALVVRLLAIRGVAAERQGSVVASPRGFAYRVAPACLGLGLAGAAAAALALRRGAPPAPPAPSGRRAREALAVAAGVLAANLIRLVALFELGAAAPGRFELAHRALGPALLLAALAAFLLFIRSGRPAAPPRTAGAR